MRVQTKRGHGCDSGRNSGRSAPSTGTRSAPTLDDSSTTEPVDGDLGYYIYLKQDEAVQPLEPEAAARLGQSAFDDWYSELRLEAEDAGSISIDEGFLGEPSSLGL